MLLIILTISQIDINIVENYLANAPVNFILISKLGGITANGAATYLIKIHKSQKEEVVEKLSSLCGLRKINNDKIIQSSTLSLSLLKTSQFEGGASIIIIPLLDYLKI